MIEAPVEGDTTRFMAVFMCRHQVGAMVGPVRSARYFNVDLFQQLRGVTFHFGGGGKVLGRLDRPGRAARERADDGWYFFYRAGRWGAPHNVFLDVDAARAEMEEGGLGAAPTSAARAGAVQVRPRRAVAGWPRGRQHRPDDVELLALRLDVGRGAGRWLRTDGGAPNFDAITGDRINARTVIVQVVRQDVLPGELDPGGFPRRYQYLVGEGTACSTSTAKGYDVRWERRDADGRDDVDLRRQRRAGRPSAGQGVVGDRADRQRDRGLTGPG